MIAPRDMYGRQGGRWADGDTPDMDDIRAAADDWPTVPCPGCDGQGGLPELTAGNRDISKCDLVMWHTVVMTHVPRPEDWPVMPVEYCGFHLITVGFFDKNPTLDIPPNCAK